MPALVFTHNQIQHALKRFAGVELSRERLRQLRQGHKSGRNGSTVTYEPFLQAGDDWRYSDKSAQVEYTVRGTRKLLARYGVDLTDDVKREMLVQPRHANAGHRH